LPQAARIRAAVRVRSTSLTTDFPQEELRRGKQLFCRFNMDAFM
jgi:hypothetical protein